MDLRKEWQRLHQQKFKYSPIEKERIMTAIYQESNSTIANLKIRLKWKINWILLFIVAGIIWMLFSLDHPELLLVQGFFVGSYILGLIALGLAYQQMDTTMDSTAQTLPFIKRQDKIIRQALNYEKIWGLIFFPIAIIGGMLVAYLYDGLSLAAIFQNTKFLMLAIGLIILLVPLMTYLSNKMNQIGYGQLMEDLQKNIRRMEDLS